jgi:uncharacterized membrane protein
MAPGGAVPDEHAKAVTDTSRDALRYHGELARLEHPFGSGGFGAIAEGIARFFGTPQYLIGQTLVVAAWIVANATHAVKFDLYPFILLNLAFSLQAAYAAPLILLASTRQAERDKLLSEADAKHREELSRLQTERTAAIAAQTRTIEKLLEQNTELTQQVRTLTGEIHIAIAPPPAQKDAGQAPNPPG